MDAQEKYRYWLEHAQYDLDTAEGMYQMKRFLYVIFMCQQAIEKLVKGIYGLYRDYDAIPRTHNIRRLINDFSDKLNEEVPEATYTLFDVLSRFLPEQSLPRLYRRSSAANKSRRRYRNSFQNKGGVRVAANIEAVRQEAIRYANEVRRELPVDKAYLFGSYAKGTADELSDVDVAFFFRDFSGKSRFQIGVDLLRLTHKYTAYLEPLVFPSSEIERGNPFVKEILKSGIEI